MTAQPPDVDAVTALVADASRAPSLHNAQPWSFRYLRDIGVLRLYADPRRALPHTDPDQRGLHIGCGAALLNLRVSAAAAGLAPLVRLLPEPGYPDLLAEAHLCAAGPPDGELAPLGPAVRRRHCSRLPFHDQAVPAAERERLCDAAAAEGAQLLFPGAWHTDSVLDLVRDAEGREALAPEVRGETESWTHPGPAGCAVRKPPAEGRDGCLPSEDPPALARAHADLADAPGIPGAGPEADGPAAPPGPATAAHYRRPAARRSGRRGDRLPGQHATPPVRLWSSATPPPAGVESEPRRRRTKGLPDHRPPHRLRRAEPPAADRRKP
ncbi:nitroreductase [Streptomyces eurythermus]|uniref:nitroreductase n=1 Tax=Streptomyces eurythermus TaxID=42237 RepID=UPI0036C00865